MTPDEPTRAVPFDGRSATGGPANYAPYEYGATNLYAPNAGTPPKASAGFSMARCILLAFAVLAAASAALGLVAGVLRSAHSAAAPAAVSCPAGTAPPGASPAAVAYQEAVNEEIPGRIRLNATLTAEDGVIHHLDLQTESEIDTAFLSRLEAIHFPQNAAHAADALKRDVREYIELMNISFQNHGYLAAHIDVRAAIDSMRSRDAAHLRAILDLPPSSCGLGHP